MLLMISRLTTSEAVFLFQIPLPDNIHMVYCVTNNNKTNSPYINGIVVRHTVCL